LERGPTNESENLKIGFHVPNTQFQSRGILWEKAQGVGKKDGKEGAGNDRGGNGEPDNAKKFFEPPRVVGANLETGRRGRRRQNVA